MSDPTPLVDHVYQMWINEHIEKVKSKKYDGYGSNRDTDLLKALYTESKVQLPGSALHNNNINYYHHTKDSIDTTHVYTPSKMYVFLGMRENVLCKFNNRKQEAKCPECILVIKSPRAAVSDSLLVTCQQIIENQTIVDLKMYNVSGKHQSEADVFNPSKNANSLPLHSCSLQSQPLNYLIHKLSGCNQVRRIDPLKHKP